ncbi:L-gulonolactone oxidase [Rhynchospora pubera]|uniref:L-gulonolactone oxidase n=1 Tax=Rhynchospora pubera TaxID=906938 RepID=A0AAV8GLG8_9POAL|nr:L-gulonolactone oxidase [Rhynchospora pubera]
MDTTITLLLFPLCFVLSSLLQTTDSLPPRSPIQCSGSSCILSNAYGRWNDRIECRVPSVVYPTTEEEIVTAVAEAVKNKKKIKVVSGFSHNIPPLSCPPSVESVLISTSRYNAGIEIDPVNCKVTVDSGVGLRDMLDQVESAGLSLVAAPYWEGVSIGGLLSTGSHGSSWWGRGGSVHDHVVGLSLVVPAGETEQYAKILRLWRGDKRFNAALVSVGLLGVISKVTFALEPRFKRSITNDFRDDTTLEEDFISHAQNHEFADITWYPSQHKAVYRIDDRVPLNSSGDGINDFLGFQSTLVVASTGVRSTEKTLEKSRSTNGKCTLASTEISYKRLIGNGLKNNGIAFLGYPVVGYQGRMQTSGSCLYSSELNPLSMCAWDPRIKGLFFYESTAIFPASEFKNFIIDVKKLRDLNPKKLCGIDTYNGILIRFVKCSDAYLGQTEDSVVVDFNYFRADNASTPRLNQDVMEEIEQMAFIKYNARPHFGKNRRVAFFGFQNKYLNWGKFMQVKMQLDPDRVFDSFWLNQVLKSESESEKEDGCALEGQCICSADRHCSPNRGYRCEPGVVYKEARVCRYSDNSAE